MIFKTTRRAAAGARIAFAASASVLALTVGLCAGQARAEDAPKAVDPENPDYGLRVSELVITAQSRAAAQAPATASLNATQPQSIITRSAIDQFIAATADYTQIANLSPSVSGVAGNGPGLSESKTTLRGFKDGEYNVTYDGIPWGDANGPTHHSTSFFPSSTIGAVVVDRGPGEASQLGQATFGGSINLFSPEVSHTMGASQSLTYGSWQTAESVTKISTGEISQLNGARFLFNFQELKTNGYLTLNKARANNQMFRGIVPLAGDWALTLFATWNYTTTHVNDNAGATLTQVGLFGKNFALTNDPTLPTYLGYNIVEKRTYFNYAKLTGSIMPSLKLENTVYSYYYHNDTESALDVTLSPTDITNNATTKNLKSFPNPSPSTAANGASAPSVINGHIPGYTKLNVYKIYGDILHLDQELSFGTIKGGLWWEKADTGPRARYDYDASSANHAPDYRQKVLNNVPQNVEYLQFSGWDQYEPFVDFEWRPLSNLTLTPGVKYVNFKLHVDSDINQKSRLPFHGAKTFEKTLYFFTANYKIGDNWSAYGQYATGFLVPDISATQVVNPNLNQLKPQESKNLQIGTVYHGDRLTFDFDAYHIDFKNKIQTVANPSTGENESFNIGGAIYKGVEGQATVLVTPSLYVFANGSFNEAKTVGVNIPASATSAGLVVVADKQLGKAPKSTAALGVIYKTGDWSASLMDKYVGEQWAADGEPAAYKLKGYHSTDLKVVYRFDRYRLEGAVYNLFDSQQVNDIKPGKTTPYDQYYYQPERNFQVSAKVSF